MKYDFLKWDASFPNLKKLTPTVIADDEKRAYPSEAIEWFQDKKLLMLLVPQKYGGELKSLEELFILGRSISRRNITTSIAFGQCLLGSLSVWISGTQDQKKRQKELFAANGNCCLALTEKEHGSDLTSTSVSFNDRVLNGEKWCINNATLGTSLTMLAHSEKGLTALYIDKAALNKDNFYYLDKIPTHGIKGADISGIGFKNCKVDETAIIGKEGKGLEVIGKTMQVSRTMCATFSMGAIDTALRMTAHFMQNRNLYGKNLYQFDSIRNLYTKSYLKALMAEAISIVMIRSITQAPEMMSLYSALAKYQVTKLVDSSIADLGEILGARSYVQTEEYALFEKMKRDHAVISIFDGSSEVNISIIAGQMQNLVRHINNGKTDKYRDVFDHAKPSKDFTGEGLKLSNRGNDLIFNTYYSYADQLNDRIRNKIKTDLDRFLEDIQKTKDLDSFHPERRQVILDYVNLSSICLYVSFYFTNKDHLGSDIDENVFYAVLDYFLEGSIDYKLEKTMDALIAGRLFSHFDYKVNEDANCFNL